MASTLCEAVVSDVARRVEPLLVDLRALQPLGTITADKGGGHTAHRIDQVAEDALFDSLRSHDFRGRVFSEESGLVTLGDEGRVLISDPYCNTTLTFRGVRESAVTAYEYTLDGTFLSGAIADLQVSRVLSSIASGMPTVVSLRSPDVRLSVGCSTTTRVQDALVVVSLLKRGRRQALPTALLRELGLLLTVDGGIVAARIAMGEIDGFVDVAFGQPSYEALAYALIPGAGGVVTDDAGLPIDFAGIVEGLLEGKVGRQTVIAASTTDLHEEIVRLVGE